MKEKGFGGGNTLTGLNFEREVDFQQLLAVKPGYEVKLVHGKAGKGVYFKGQLVARCFRKHDFYDFLDEEGVNWKPILSGSVALFVGDFWDISGFREAWS